MVVVTYLVFDYLRKRMAKKVSDTSNLIKCNFSSNGEKIYHMPGDKLYDVTTIDESKGELYVTNKEAAELLGFRRSKVK